MKKAVWIGIIAFVFVLLLFGGILFFSLSSQSIVQGGSPTCPQDQYCTAIPILKCTTPQVDAKVILRTNAPNWNKDSFISAGTMIALDSSGTGALSGYVKGTSQTSPCTGTNLFANSNIGIDFIYKDSYGKIYVCDSSGSKMYQFIPTTLIPTSVSHIDGWQEKYQGNLYSCSQDVLIAGVKKETLSWSKDYATPTDGIRGSTYNMNAGESMTAKGSGWFGVDYEVHSAPVTTCTLSNGTRINIGDKICTTPYKLESCENIGGVPTLTKQDAVPPKICRNGAITDAYTVSITIPKLVLSKSEHLSFDFSLQGTDNNENIDVTATIMKNNQYVTSKTQKTGNSYLTAGKTSFSFDTLPTGYYTLKVSFSHPDGDYSKEYTIQVTEDLALTLTANNPIQFDSSDIEVNLNSFRSGSPKDLTNFDLDATYNGAKVYQYTTEHPSLGMLKFKFPLKGDGTLRLRARGNDESGLWTDWTDYFEVTVKKATILISTDFKTDQCTGSLTQSFQTKDSLGNYVDTQNQITIDKPLGGKDSASATGSNGNYKFSYNFADGGIYTIRISSSNAQLGSSQLNSGQGQIVNILTGSACGGGGGGCTGISCYLTYIIIGVVILAIGIFVYFVFFFRRKR